MTNKTSEIVNIAKIIKPHGIKGEVKIISFTEKPLDLLSYKNVFDKYHNKIVFNKIKKLKNLYICLLENVNDRDTAEKFTGLDLFVDRREFAELQEEEFYFVDLVGLKVLDYKHNSHIGFVKAIHNFGANDIVEIEFSTKKNDNMFDFCKGNFPEINIDGGYIIFKEGKQCF